MTYNRMQHIKTIHSYLLSLHYNIVHTLGVCMTYKTGFGFVDQIYWPFIKLATTFHKPLSSTGHSRLLNTLHSSTSLSLSLSLESKSKLLYDWRFTANQSVLASSPLRPVTRDSFPQLNPCGNSPHVTSSQMRRWVCLLRICLVFHQVCISHI
jgi:hypothetical protein